MDVGAVCLTARSLWAGLFGESVAWVASHGMDPVPQGVDQRFLRIRARLEAGEPVAYLLGGAPFRGRNFKVTRATLIPRPETEQLVDLVLSVGKEGSIYVDIGTGSGCIGVSLALERGPERVILTDRSRRALKIAQENAKKWLGPAADRLMVLQGSLFSRRLQQELIHRGTKEVLIVANLPYLPLSDQRTLARGVTAFEPSLALYGGPQGDELVRRLLKQIQRFQRAHPAILISVFLEIDPPQAKALLKEAASLFPGHRSEIVRDGFGRERFLVVR